MTSLNSGEDLPICFVISPIGKEGSVRRQKADDAFWVFAQAAKRSGFQARRADHSINPGMVTPDVVEYILTSPMVIADLSESNPNVYYELSIRHVAQLPTVHVMHQGVELETELPFDLKDTSLVRYNTSHRLASKSIKEISKYLKEAKRKSTNTENVLTPIMQRLGTSLILPKVSVAPDKTVLYNSSFTPPIFR